MDIKKILTSQSGKKRTRSFAFIIIYCGLIPISFFILLEVLLRLFDYGFNPSFFVKDKIGGKEYYVNNYKFSWRFFPKPLARLSTAVVVPVEKDKDALRVFVFGESAAMGDPEPAFGFSRQLGVMLEKKYPTKKIEIYNTAVTAINSNAILPIAKECLKLQPDLFIVYMGNNEVIGPYGLSNALTPFFSNRWVIKAQIGLSETRTGQLIKSLSEDKKTNFEEWRGMEMFMKNKVRHDSPELESIYNHYRDNLNEICNTASDAGVKVVLATMITNERDCSPFISLHKSGLNKGQLNQWQDHYKKAIALDSIGKHEEALELYKKSFSIDDEHAELNFRMGKCYLKLNQLEEAKLFFSKARNYDALRFRADDRINEIIREVAASMADRKIYLADVTHLANQQSKQAIPGNDLLYEHVHLNLKGNHVLANGVLQQIEKALNLRSPMEVVTLEDCKTRLGYTAFDEKRIDQINLTRIQSPPFTNQYTNVFDKMNLQNEVQRMNDSFDSSWVLKTDSTYRYVSERYPSDWFVHINYMLFLYEYKFHHAAATQADQLFALLPFEYFSNLNMGTTRMSLKKYTEAEMYFRKAIAINPYFSEAFRNMTALFKEQKKFNQIPPYLHNGHPSPIEVAEFYNQTGVAFAKDKNLDSAIVYFERALKIMPTFDQAQKNRNQAMDIKQTGVSPKLTPEFSEVYNQANAFFKQGDFTRAIAYYEKAIRLNPSFPKAHNNMGIAFIQMNKLSDAKEHFAEAIRLDAGFIEAYPNLAILLISQGRHQEAIEVLQRGIKQKEDPELYHMMGTSYLEVGDKLMAEKCFQKEKMMSGMNSN